MKAHRRTQWEGATCPQASSQVLALAHAVREADGYSQAVLEQARRAEVFHPWEADLEFKWEDREWTPGELNRLIHEVGPRSSTGNRRPPWTPERARAGGTAAAELKRRRRVANSP